MELINVILSVLSNTQLGVVSSILTIPLLAWVMKTIKTFDERGKKRDAATCCLLQTQLETMHRKAIRHRGGAELMPPDMIDNFYECYECYKDLGGNGFADRLKQDMDVIRDAMLMANKGG
jgi:hypothetical protein